MDAALCCRRTTVVAVLGSPHASGPLNTLINDITRYTTTNVSGYAAEAGVSHERLRKADGSTGLLVDVKAKLDAAAALSVLSTYSTNAGMRVGTAPSIATTDAVTYVSSANTALTSMPNTANLVTNMNGAKTAYTALGSSPSQVS